MLVQRPTNYIPFQHEISPGLGSLSDVSNEDGNFWLQVAEGCFAFIPDVEAEL